MIKGLSDKRRFTRGGHLRLGRKVQGQRGLYPQKSDHFIADFENPEVEALFYRLYGAEPKRVSICFGGEEIEDVFPQFYKCYGKSAGLKCKGDGEFASRITAEGELEEVECPTPEHCDYGKQNGCKQMAAMQFFIKGLPGIQVFQVNTTSFNSIININSGIELLQTVRRGRSIRGVWVDLCLVEQAAQVNGKAVTIYVLKLDIPVSLDNLNALECAFDVPAALPAPDETRDEYLTPTVPPAPAPTGPSAEAKQAFADTCARNGRDVKEEWKLVAPYYGIPSWDAVTDADLAVYCATLQPAPVTVLTPVNTATHPDYIRFKSACEFAGIDAGQAMIALLSEHDTTETAALPPGAILRRASEIETAAMPTAAGFQV